MRSVYCESLIKVIKNKTKALQNENFFEFYSESQELLHAFDIAIFILAEDEIITIDKSNTDISSRYTLNEDVSLIQSIFEGKDFREYFDDIQISEPNGDNIWFLAALRNSIVHGCIEYIDLEKKEIYIKSSNNLNRLECTIPLNFFSKFIACYKEMRNKKESTNSFAIYLRDYNNGSSSFSRSRQGRQKKFDYLVGVDSNTKLDESTVDNITNTIVDLYHSIIDTIYGDFEGKEIEPKLHEDVNNIIANVNKDNVLLAKNSSEYNTILKENIGHYLKIKIEYIFSQYNITVEPYEHSNRPIEFNQRLVKQIKLSMAESSRIVKGKKGNSNFIDELLYLRKQFETQSYYIKTIQDYLSPDAFNSILKSKRFFDYYDYNNNNAILKAIHITRTQNGEEHTYIDDFFNEIVYSENRDFKFLTIRKYAINYMKTKNKESLSFKEKKSIIENYKSLYNMYCETAKTKNKPSKEDKETFKKLFNKRNLNRLIRYCSLQKEQMLIGLLYTYGINVYVLSKEQESEFEADYDIFDFYNMNLYTAERTRDLDVLNRNIKIKKASKKRLENIIKPGTPDAIKSQFNDSIKKLNAEIEKLQKSLPIDKSTIRIGGQTLTIDNDDNEKKATVIRNCLAHNGRIKIAKQHTSENNQQIVLNLIDLNEKGKTTALIQCTLNDLLKFIEFDYKYRFPKQNKNDAHRFEEETGPERIATGVNNLPVVQEFCSTVNNDISNSIGGD